jgi:hypothetical protein
MRPIARYGFLGNVRKLLSQATFFIDAKEATVGQTASNLGTGGSVLDAQYGSTTGADTNDPLLLEHDGTNYLYLPGSTGNFASSPNSAAINITGDIDIRAFIACDDWSSSTGNWLVGKWTSPNRSFLFLLDTSGRMEFQWSTDGLNLTNFAISTAALPIPDGTDFWLRVTLDVDNGAAGNTTTFFISEDGVTWAQLGTPIVAAGVTSIFAGTNPLSIGQLGPGSGGIFAGKYYRLQIRNGIGGTVVFDADFTTGITSGGQTTFTESSSNAATVTINRVTSGRKSVAVVRDVWLFGTDDYMEVADNDLIDFGASDDFTIVAVARYWGTIANNSIVGKGTGNIGATMQGYQMFFSSGVPSFRLGDGTTRVGGVSVTTATSGNIAAYSFHRDVASDRVWAERNGTESTGRTTDTTTGTLATSEKLYIGGQAATGFSDCELLAVAIFRRTLGDSELVSIANYYGAS